MAKTVAEQQDHVDRFLESVRESLPPDLDLTVEGIVDRISGLGRRLKQMMEETLADHDLTWGEWKLLGLLLHQGEPYRLSPGKLAKDLELSSGAMTNRLDQLEQAGLIRRQPDPNDRRSVQVELTPAGEQAYRQPTETAAAKEALIASALNGREREQLNGYLRRLMIAFEELDPNLR
jgi:DNA-binding MarR family transcriptional regulator